MKVLRKGLNLSGPRLEKSFRHNNGRKPKTSNQFPQQAPTPQRQFAGLAGLACNQSRYQPVINLTPCQVFCFVIVHIGNIKPN